MIYGPCFSARVEQVERDKLPFVEVTGTWAGNVHSTNHWGLEALVRILSDGTNQWFPTQIGREHHESFWFYLQGHTHTHLPSPSIFPNQCLSHDPGVLPSSRLSGFCPLSAACYLWSSAIPPRADDAITWTGPPWATKNWLRGSKNRKDRKVAQSFSATFITIGWWSGKIDKNCMNCRATPWYPSAEVYVGWTLLLTTWIAIHFSRAAEWLGTSHGFLLPKSKIH